MRERQGGNVVTTGDVAATSPLLRRLNTLAVLDVLRAAGPVTAAELMDRTGLSRPTVHTVSDLLISRGWVTELDSVKTVTGVGRRARCYQFNSTAGYVFGIDLGVERVSVLLADLRGRTVATQSRTPSDPLVSARERVRIARRLMAGILASTGVEVERIAACTVGVPAPVTTSGRVLASREYLPGMADIDLRGAIGKGHHWPVLLANDANLAVLGERWRGVGQGVDNIILLLAGERMGAGIYLQGRLIEGSNGSAGEMTFLQTVEHLGTANGILWLGRTLGGEAVGRTSPVAPERIDPRSLYGLSAGRPDRVDSDMVFDAARAGDPVAVGVVQEMADRMARVVAVLATLLNPEVVVIAGVAGSSIDVLLEPLERRLPRYTVTPPVIRATSLGQDGVLLGAIKQALGRVEATLFDQLSAKPAM